MKPNMKHDKHKPRNPVCNPINTLNPNTPCSKLKPTEPKDASGFLIPVRSEEQPHSEDLVGFLGLRASGFSV